MHPHTSTNLYCLGIVSSKADPHRTMKVSVQPHESTSRPEERGGGGGAWAVGQTTHLLASLPAGFTSGAASDDAGLLKLYRSWPIHDLSKGS